MQPVTTGLMQLPSVVSKEDDKLILRGRVKDPESLCSIHQMFFNADLLASQKRAVIQSMVDGAAPYSEARDRMTGQAGRANINWQQLTDALDEAVKPYNTLLESIDVFGDIPTKHGDDNSRMRWEPILAEEITRTIRNWPSFFSVWQQNARTFKMDGVAFAFFEDDIDWRWKVKGMQYVKMPREVPADVEELDMITCETVMYPHTLYRKVEAEKHLPEKERYWNRDACLVAIREAAPVGLDLSNWEAVERAWKDNDLTYGLTSKVIRIIHGWVKELDGTVTHLISRYSGGKAFLYKCVGKYGAMSELLTAYTDGVGTNGDFHSIRGLGYKLFGAAQGQNRLRNKMLDGACAAATPHFTAESEDAITDRSIFPMGPYQILANKMQYAEGPKLNISQNVAPVLQMMDMVFTSKAASSAPVTTNAISRTQKTAYQVQSEEEQTGALLSGSFFLFMSSWERQFRNVVKRLCRRDYQMTDPGGPSAWELRNRLVARGVPLEALYEVDVPAITINMGIGKGSVSDRRAALSAVYDVQYAAMDQEARNIMDRARAISYLGSRLGGKLFPESPGQRPPVDAQVAQLENSVMSMGQPSAFTTNQDHVVHVETHLAFLYQLNTAFEQQAIQLREAIDQMQPVWEHCINDHMPLISDRDPDYGRFKEALQQLGEFITNSRKHLTAEDMRAAEEQAEAEVLQPDNLGLLRAATDANARAAAKDQVAIEAEKQKIQAARAEERRREESHRQKLAINDATTAAKLITASRKKP